MPPCPCLWAPMPSYDHISQDRNSIQTATFDTAHNVDTLNHCWHITDQSAEFRNIKMKFQKKNLGVIPFRATWRGSMLMLGGARQSKFVWIWWYCGKNLKTIFCDVKVGNWFFCSYVKPPLAGIARWRQGMMTELNSMASSVRTGHLQYGHWPLGD